MRETVYYQRNAPDPVLDEATVLHIVRQHVADAKALSAIDESGGEARAYAVDDNIILKVQRPQQLRSSTSLEKEVLFLKQLEKQTNVSVPRVLGYGKKDGIEYICMTRMHGTAAENVKFTNSEKKALLLELGKELRKIHSIDQQPFLDSGLFPRDEPEDLKERIRRRYLNALRKKADLSPARMNLALETMEQELSMIQNAGEFVALHVNPYLPHVFVDKDTHQYSGIIDFGDAYIGHPIFDMWYWKAKSRKILLRAYTAEKPVSENFLKIFESLNRISIIMQDYI